MQDVTSKKLLTSLPTLLHESHGEAENALETWRLFLLGQVEDVGEYDQHLVLLSGKNFPHENCNAYHFDLDAKWIQDEAKRLGLRLGKAGTQIKFRPQDVNFSDESGNVVANLQEIVHSKYPKGVSKSATKVHVHKFDKPTFLDSSNRVMPRYKVLSVKFTITTTRHVRRTPTVGTPVVEFILENVSVTHDS